MSVSAEDQINLFRCGFLSSVHQGLHQYIGKVRWHQGLHEGGKAEGLMDQIRWSKLQGLVKGTTPEGEDWWAGPRSRSKTRSS